MDNRLHINTRIIRLDSVLVVFYRSPKSHRPLPALLSPLTLLFINTFACQFRCLHHRRSPSLEFDIIHRHLSKKVASRRDHPPSRHRSVYKFKVSRLKFPGFVLEVFMICFVCSLLIRQGIKGRGEKSGI